MENNFTSFIQCNSPDGGFLQSQEWWKFQESTGRKTYNVSSDNFYANIVEHSLPLVGKYFYVPRGPVLEITNNTIQISNKSQNPKSKIQNRIQELIILAKKEKAGWIRIEPSDGNALGEIRNNTKYKIVKAPHDVQPKEIFLVDITKPEEQLLAEMKAKTRYNIRLAQKHKVSVRVISNSPNYLIPNKISNDKIQISNKSQNTNDQNYNFYRDKFIELVEITAKRDGITSHPENYYRKMLEVIPGDILKLYVAEYKGKIIAANLVVFYGDVCTYLHGASDDEHRNVMAPYSLQWQQIKDAKAAGCKKYDFGGINTKTGAGITKFKIGFSPETQPVTFPGSYDIIVNRRRYWMYRGIQKVKSLVK